MSLNRGGAETLVLTVSNALVEMGVDTRVAYVLDGHNELVATLNARAPIESLSASRPWDVRWIAQLYRLLRRTEPQVIHFHSPFVAALGRPVVKIAQRRTRVVSTVHNSWRTLGRATRLLAAATAWMDDARLAVSDATAESLPRHYRSRTEVLTHGVDVARVASAAAHRSAMRSELGVGSSTVVIAAVANFRPTKDHQNLLRAVALLPSQLDVFCVLVGDGELRAQIQQLRDALHLHGRVRLLGSRPDVARVLSGCDVFCLSSRMEGNPVALMEAFALGLPTVATRVGGIPDAVRDGVDGLLVPPRDAEALASALASLITDPARRRKMGRAAAERSEVFDIRRAAKRHAELYISLLEETAP